MVEPTVIATTLEPISNSARVPPQNDRTTEWIKLWIYVDIPRGEYPLEVGWRIVQGRTLVKRVPFGSYKKPNLHSIRLRVRADEEFTFIMNMQRSTYGKGEFHNICTERFPSNQLEHDILHRR